MTDQRTQPEIAPVNGGGTLLDASHISKVFGGLVAVNDVTFRVPPKAIVSLINRYLLKELNGLPDKLGLDFDVTSINFGIFGFLLLVMMVLRPEGLLPSSRRKLELHADVDETDHIGAASDHQYYDEREA